MIMITIMLITMIITLTKLMMLTRMLIWICLTTTYVKSNPIYNLKLKLGPATLLVTLQCMSVIVMLTMWFPWLIRDVIISKRLDDRPVDLLAVAIGWPSVNKLWIQWIFQRTMQGGILIDSFQDFSYPKSLSGENGRDSGAPSGSHFEMAMNALHSIIIQTLSADIQLVS